MAHKLPKDSTPAVQRGHEIFDLDMSYVRWFSVGIVALLIVTAMVAFRMMGGFRVPTPPAVTLPAVTAPAVKGSASASFPVLQSAPQEDLRTYRGGKGTSLEGYGWIDRKDGIVHVPIERAMELVAAPRPDVGRTR
jgi:hypothetical protein